MKIYNNKLFLILVAIVLLTTGCAPTTSTDTTENTNTDSTVTSLENEVITKDNSIKELTNNLTVLQNDNASLQSEIESLNQQLSEIPAAPASLTLLQTSINVMQAIKDQDMVTLSSYVHSSQGVRISPYAYVNNPGDQVFSATAILTAYSSPTVLNWGTHDGSGDPINLDFASYYAEFIYDEDYISPHLIGVNTFIGTGNMINNVSTVYPSASFVEFHFTGFNPTYAGMDWTSLILVFENVGGNWKLVGIVHNQWTI